MLSDMVLVHRRGPDVFRFKSGLQSEDGLSESSARWVLWQTCLRKIAFGSVDSFGEIDRTPGDEIYRGDEAYRFCLEIVCGLHSPLVGETEVQGQFKNTVAAWELPNSPWGTEMRRFVRRIFEDAKKIRATHLDNLGGQSYGSLLRKELRDIREVHVIGGGHLTGEILPWLAKDGMDVHVHVRNLERVSALRREFQKVHFHQLSQNYDHPSAGHASKLSGALIVSAPVTSTWLVEWCRGNEADFERVADLRGDSAVDKLGARFSRTTVIMLEELMRRISENQELLAERRSQALAMIAQLVASRRQHIEYRPFGWEDVCA